MKRKDKTREQLLDELAMVRLRIIELERIESEHNKVVDSSEHTAAEWRATFDAMKDMVFILDRDFIITKANKSAIDTLKLKLEDIVGKKCYHVVHKTDKPWSTHPFARLKKDKKDYTELVEDSQLGIPLLITYSPILDDKGKLTGVVYVARDVSEAKKSEKILKEKIHQLKIFHKAAVGRELKMVKLKKKIEEQETELKDRSRYREGD